MLDSVRLCHIIPFDIGIDFWNPTESSIVVDNTFYQIVNSPSSHIEESKYTKGDIAHIQSMRSYLFDVRSAVRMSNDPAISSAEFVSSFPNITGCISKFVISSGEGSSLSCHIMQNGTGVIYETSGPIEIEDESHFALPLFYERQIIEDDYYINQECSPRKRIVYAVLRLLWDCAKNKTRSYSASNKYRCQGIPYTLPIAVVDIPGFQSNDINEQLQKNIRSIVDTSAFSNILNKEQWQTIKHLVDKTNNSDFAIQELSESLICAHGWSGVVITGDLSKNNAFIKDIIDYDIFLQSFWVYYDALSEEIIRSKFSTIELQKLKNELEYSRVFIDNDISSNIEQSKLNVRRSIFQTSNIEVIYNRANGLTENKLRIQIMEEDRKKRKYSLLSEIALFIIALLQIYDVIRRLFNSNDPLLSADYITLAIIFVISVVVIVIMIKGHH